jgi:hypothetical protein
LCLSTNRTDTRPSQQEDQHGQPDLPDQCKIDPVERTGHAATYHKPTPRRNATSIHSTRLHYRSRQPDQRNVNPASQVRGTEGRNPPGRHEAEPKDHGTHARSDRLNQPKSIQPTETIAYHTDDRTNAGPARSSGQCQRSSREVFQNSSDAPKTDPKTEPVHVT